MLFTLGALALPPLSGLRAEEVIELDWKDLIPPEQANVSPVLQGIVQHQSATQPQDQHMNSVMRADFNGRTVRLSGFVIPLDYSEHGTKTFILAPYVGACIHVPPPPPNQLVLVTTSRPYKAKRLFQAVTVTGMFGAATASTQLAEIGYALSADHIREGTDG